MNKREYIALLIDYFSGGACPADLRGRYDERVMERYFEMFYTDVIYNVHRNAVTYSDYSQFDAYAKSYEDVAILKNESRNEYYSVLPATPIELPKNRGIRQVSPMQSQEYKFFPAKNNDADVRGTLEGQSAVGYTSYYREGGKVFYRRLNPIYIGKGLLFKLIVPLSEFEDTDNIGIPGINASQIFMAIVEIMRGRQAEKKSNNDSSKQV